MICSKSQIGIRIGDQMIKLYYAPDNASLVLRLTLEEAAVPYEAVLVDRAVRAQKTPDYLALNPTGKIPTLFTDDGIITETAACLLWLAETYPGQGLGPGVGAPERATFLRWLFYLSNTIHPDLNRLFYADRFVPQACAAEHHDKMADHLRHHLGILDQAVRADPKLFAPPSVLSFYIGPLLRWSALYPVSAKRWLDLATFPALEALVHSLETRQSVRLYAKAEGLGSTPFSRPRLPTPPEGSAT